MRSTDRGLDDGAPYDAAPSDVRRSRRFTLAAPWQGERMPAPRTIEQVRASFGLTAGSASEAAALAE